MEKERTPPEQVAALSYAAPPPTGRTRFRSLSRYLTLFAGLLVLFVAGAVTSPGFLSISNQRDVLEQVSINGILAIGMTLVILTAGIDLSVGSILSLCSVVCAMLLMYGAEADEPTGLSRAHWMAFPAVGLFVGLAAYALSGRWFHAYMRAGIGVAAFVATLLALAYWAHPRASGVAAGRFSTWSVLVVVPLVGGMLGMLSGVIIAKTRLQPFIVTLAMMISAVGLAKFVAGHGGQVHSIYIETADQAGAPASFAALGKPLLTVGQDRKSVV